MNNKILVRQSQVQNSQGGDISFESLPLYDNVYTIELSPEESFFSTEIYKGFYIQNISDEEIVDMSIISIGGLNNIEEEEALLNKYFKDDAINLKVDMVDLSGGDILKYDDVMYDSDKLTFYDWLYDRYKRNQPPYLPSWNELESLNVDYTNKDAFPQRQEFENLKYWFKLNILTPAAIRNSMFGQIDTTIYVPSDRVLFPIDEKTEIVNFQRKSGNFPYLDPYDPQNNRYIGCYWGFYLKIDVDFIPDWSIGVDFTSLLVTWTGIKDGVSTERQQLIKINVNGNMQGILEFNNKTMEDLYSKYPPFFKYYED